MVERAGVATVTLAMERGVEAPRVAFVPFPYNYPMGEPGDPERHREVALGALGLLDELDGPDEVELPLRWRGAGFGFLAPRSGYGGILEGRRSSRKG